MFVSIIIPTYNRCGMLLRAVDSVLNQSHQSFEIIIVDDGSTDSTPFFIKQYQDPRLFYYQIQRSGVSFARNFGVKKSRADWICFLDSDDVWRKNKLNEQILFHQKNRDYLISQTDDVWIRSSQRVNKMKKHQLAAGDIFLQSLRLCLICCSAVMIQKDFFWSVGGFDESLPTCEDYDLWLKILAHHPLGIIQKPLVTKFGGHDDQLSKAFAVMDVYRLRSLRRLLESGLLSSVQKKQVLEEIDYKQTIFDLGRSKRTAS